MTNDTRASGNLAIPHDADAPHDPAKAMVNAVTGPVEVTQADRNFAADYGIRFGRFGELYRRAIEDGKWDHTDDVQLAARHRLAARERAQADAIVFLAKAAHAIAWQAGVGGRETAGAIVSYLATAPDEIAPFFADKLSPIDFAGDWMRGGCLSWHSVRGEIMHPTAIRETRNVG